MILAPNIEIFFDKLPYPERIARVAALGFQAVDMFWTQGKDLAALKKALQTHKVTVGMVVGSELKRGLNDPALHAEIEQKVRGTARDAAEIGARVVTVLSGDMRPKVSRSAQNRAIMDGLKRLAPIADEYGVMIVLEMLNSRCDHPGYYLDDTELMTDLVRAVNHPRIKGLYDIYHAGIMRGDVIEDLRASLDAIGHIHIAGIPGRHEPKNGEQNYPVICRALDEAGYRGLIGLEYWPLKDSEESLRETQAWIGS